MITCPADKAAIVPQELAARFSFPEVHCDSSMMADFAEAQMKWDGDVYATVPFCSTVEAEAFGAEVRLGDEKTTPLVHRCRWKNIDDVKLDAPDPLAGRMGTVMKALELLKARRVPSVLEMAGPFSVLMGLLEPGTIFKCLSKEPERVIALLGTISGYLEACARQAARRGAALISLAEPAATADLVGPRVFKRAVGPQVVGLMKRMSAIPGDWAGFLCGRLSISLVESGQLKERRIALERRRYGEVLEEYRAQGVKWFGGSCIAQTAAFCTQICLIDFP